MSTDARPNHLTAAAEHRTMLRDCLAMVSGSNLATVCGAVSSLVMRAAIDPPLMGVWSTVRVLLEYGGYNTLGLNRAAARDIAIAAGRGDERAGAELASVAMTWELLGGAAVALALVAAAAWQAAHGSLRWAAALAVAAGIAVIGRYHGFSLAVLRSHKRFPVLAQARVVGAVADVLFLAGGAYLFGFYGLVAGALVCHAWNACFIRFAGGLRFTGRAAWVPAWRMILTGWPIAAEALALAALRSVDRLVIVHYLANGDEQLGFYSVAMLLASWAFDQSNLIANVVYPRLAEMMGRTSDAAAVMGMALRAAERMALALIPCCIALVALGSPALAWILPKYQPGLAAAAALVAGSAVLGISMPLRYGLITVGRTFPMLGATALSGAASLAGATWIVRHGGTLSQVAWNSVAADALCLVLLLALSGGKRRTAWACVGRVLVASVALVVGAVIVRRPLETGPVTWIAVGVWCLVPLSILAQQIDWRSLLTRPTRADPPRW